MSNSTTTLDTISPSQATKEVTANAIDDAESPAADFGLRASTTAALTWGYYGANYLLNGVPTQLANGTLALTASRTQCIEAAFVSTTTAPITGITIASPCVVTSVGHPFGIGDVLRMVSIVGTTELNGSFAKVTAIAVNTVTLDITSVGLTAYSSGGTLARVTTGGTVAMQVGKGLGTIAAAGTFICPISLFTAVVGASTKTSHIDYRMSNLEKSFSGRLVKAMADANQVLSIAEQRNEIIETTGALTALRDVIVLPYAKQWTVFANVTGGFGVRVITPVGTGITVADGKRAIVSCDGTNIVRVTADT